VFGVDYYKKVELKVVEASNRFQMLQSGDVDVLASWDTHTMERDILEVRHCTAEKLAFAISFSSNTFLFAYLQKPSTGAGFTFSTPYLYDGMVVAGIPPYSTCANSENSTSCTGVHVCAVEGTTYIALIEEFIPGASITTSLNMEGVYQNFIDGTCNVLASDQFALAESAVRAAGYSGEYETIDSFHSRDPLSLVTRDGDPVWSDFVNWVVEGLFSAEEKGFTQFTSLRSFEKIDMFGEEFQGMFVHILGSAGNYGELYDRHFETLVPRVEVNTINEGASGLIYSMPFGNMEEMGPDAVDGDTLSNIIERGYVRCGISRRAIFALFDSEKQEWSGFDVDFCRALSAAIFGGVRTKVEFTDLSATERFEALHNGDVDVLSRITTVTFARDVLEPKTFTGFSFTRPNFYDGLGFGGIPPFGACADNLDSTTSECRDLKICVNEGTTFFKILQTLFPARAIVPKESGALVAEGLSLGECNAITGGVIDTSRTNVRSVGRYDGDYETGQGRFSKDPLALVTRQDDQQWSAFVFWTVTALFYADEQGITSQTADLMPLSNLFGSRFSGFFRDIVESVGSYGDIYDRNVEFEVARGGPNLVNEYPFGPQLFSLPGLN
jgi:general L-amino acid transport system substrate-binding protein